MSTMQDRVVIITGGAAGLGAAAVRGFAAAGAVVECWDLADERGEALAAELAQVTYRHVNVTDAADVDQAMQAAVDAHGRLDVLVNNAGITRDATLLKMEDAQFDQVIDVNLKGVFHCGRAAARLMVAQGSGCIINTSSVVALYGNFGQTNYVATKSGVIGMTKVWARELGRKGVRVNAVAPGFIATEMVMAMPEKVRTMMAEKAPMQRLGRPEEIADAYLFLASDAASFVNGAVLSVDGGLTL
ncbi:MAG: glucose 1-dehydrogenase [Candidatus Krumholzibacteriia bacterium]